MHFLVKSTLNAQPGSRPGDRKQQYEEEDESYGSVSQAIAPSRLLKARVTILHCHAPGSDAIGKGAAKQPAS